MNSNEKGNGVSLASTEASVGRRNTSSFAIKLILSTLGLMFSFLTYDHLVEKMTKHKYGDGAQAVEFKNSGFLVFINKLISFLIAGLCLQVTSSGKVKIPSFQFSVASLSNVCGSLCRYRSLRYVSFPTQVLGKTSKVIPVMLMGRIVAKRTYAYYEYGLSLLICIGVTLFLTAAGSSKHSSTQTLSGFLLMIGFIVVDSFTVNWQSHLFTKSKISSIQMMYSVNFFSCFITSIPLIIGGGMVSPFGFMMRYPSFATDVLTISFASAIGQLLTFYMIAEFGPLVFTTIMVIRQMLSIMLSCLKFGHVLTGQAIFGIVIVFLALSMQVYMKYLFQRKKKKQC